MDDGQANPFSILVIAVLLGVGIAGFGAFLLLGAYAPDLRNDAQGGANALSKSAVGFSGLVDLLRAMDVQVTINRIPNGVARPALSILTPPANGKPIPWDRLLGASKATLIVLPKWQVAPSADHPGWVDRTGLVDETALAALLPSRAEIARRPDAARPILHGGTGLMRDLDALQPSAIDRLQTIDGSADWTPVLLDDDNRVLLARWTQPSQPAIYLLSDPDLLDTQGLKDPTAARAASTMLDVLRDDGTIGFDVTLDGFGHSPNLLQLLFQPPLLAATLCATASALLILVMAFHRFGPVVAAARSIHFGKRALADNTAGFIAMGRREPGMALPYLELTRSMVLRALGVPLRLDRRGADGLLDEASEARGLAETYTDLARGAGDVIDRDSLVDLARRVHRWSEGLRRGHH